MNDKIRAVIIDDEETAIDNLCFELKKYPWISVEGIACNGKAGIRLLEKERPDLLFLDVELPDMLGMDLAIKVHEQQNWDMHIVFYTAYNKYLIDALRSYAFDFLLKPVDSEELSRMGSGPAVYYRFSDLKVPVGFISAIHGKFCDTCNRVRLTAEGYLKLCLCYDEGEDLRRVLREGEKENLRTIPHPLCSAKRL